VEDVVRLVRVANPADPYNVNHPRPMVANASTALAHTADDVVHPRSVRVRLQRASRLLEVSARTDLPA
jgi:hypothetical protein